MKPPRPSGIKFLIVLISFIAVWNFIRFITAITFWDLLSEYHLKGGPFFIAISGATWAIVASFIEWTVLRTKHWAWGMSLGLVIGYGIWSLFDQMLLQAIRTNRTFEWLITIIWLIIFSIVISLKNVRKYFHG